MDLNLREKAEYEWKFYQKEFNLPDPEEDDENDIII